MMPARRLHPAWIVLGALTVCMLASTGVRSVFGVYIKPMEEEMHWSRGALSTAAALGLLLLGAAGPFAGRLADRWGPARVFSGQSAAAPAAAWLGESPRPRAII